jgi:hypothetical protein
MKIPEQNSEQISNDFQKGFTTQTPKIKSEEVREELYRIVDAFLTEAKDQNGNERSLNRLNEDRHLAVDRILSIIKERENRIVSKAESLMDIIPETNVNERLCGLVEFIKQTK